MLGTRLSMLLPPDHAYDDAFDEANDDDTNEATNTMMQCNDEVSDDERNGSTYVWCDS